MKILNSYKTKKCIIRKQRCIEYKNQRSGYCKDFRLNHVNIFKEIPDDVYILVNYVDQMALRTMYIHDDIILHSIYIQYPELFEY